MRTTPCLQTIQITQIKCCGGGHALAAAIALPLLALWRHWWHLTRIHPYGTDAHTGYMIAVIVLPFALIAIIAGLYVWLNEKDLAWSPAQVEVIRVARTWEVLDRYVGLTVYVRVLANQCPQGTRWTDPTEVDPDAFILSAEYLNGEDVRPHLTQAALDAGGHELLDVDLATTRWDHKPRIRLPYTSKTLSLTSDEIPVRYRSIAKPNLTAYQWSQYREGRAAWARWTAKYSH